MTDVTINEWKRHGLHRAYANDGQQARLGYVDVPTGTVSLEDGVPAEPVTSLLLAWHAARAGIVVARPGTVATASKPDWQDLASNKPGQSILSIAEAEERESIEAHERAMGKMKSRVTRALVGDTKTSWRKGYEGEEKVGERLEKLSKHGWRFLHSIQTGPRSDIDHLGIGPGGVVLVNTKAHPDAKIRLADWGIIVDGNRSGYAKQVKEQASRAQTALTNAAGCKVAVHPLLVIYVGSALRSKEIEVIGRPGVEVATHLNMWLYFKGMEPVLSPKEVDELYDIARRSTTWR